MLNEILALVIVGKLSHVSWRHLIVTALVHEHRRVITVRVVRASIVFMRAGRIYSRLELLNILVILQRTFNMVFHLQHGVLRAHSKRIDLLK